MTRLTLTDVRKRYGRTEALTGIDLELESGSITGLVGPNGAGKSTLMRILCGEEATDAGTILIDGAVVADLRNRVALVHQEPQVWLNLSVAENLMVGREAGLFGRVGVGVAAADALQRLSIERYARTELSGCPLAVRQRVEIARALMTDASIFLFDEPNSALTEAESAALFASMHELASSGSIVILVSHRLAEVVRHCASVVVIRDGRVACELDGDASEDAIARELVVGHRREGISTDAARTAIAGIGTKELAPGFITALMGVEGSGVREILKGLWASGADSAIQFVPADRRDSLFSNLSVGENCVIRMPPGRITGRLGFLARQTATELARSAIVKLGVKAEGPAQSISALSGGNQQKVVVAAALAAAPSALIVEEPTRGVDVGSKADIYEILRDAAEEGLVVLLLCTEVPEAFDVADRVLVVDGGQVVVELLVGEYPDVGSLAAAVAMAQHTELEQLPAPEMPLERTERG